MVKFSNHKQGTQEWLAERAGFVTASCLGDLLATDKKTGKPLKSRETYLRRVVTERIYGEPMESPQAYALQWGHDAEPYARREAQIFTGETIVEAGFARHPKIKFFGASVDGLIGDDGTYESKCPKNSAVHMLTWEHGMPEEHIPQVQGQLAVTGRQWCMFVSYDPRAPKEFQLYVQHVQRDEKYIADMEKKVKVFLAEATLKIDFLNKKAKLLGDAE